MERRITLLLAVALIFSLLYMSQLPGAQPAGESHISMAVYPDGLVEVNYTIYTNGSQTLSVFLVGEPLEAYGILVVDGNNNPLAYDINKSTGVMDIITLGAKKVFISYVTESLTSKSGETWTLKYVAPLSSTVYLPPGALVTYIAPVPQAVDAVDNMPVLSFPPGPVKVEYIILHTPPPRTGQQGGGSSTQTGQQPSQQPGQQGGQQTQPGEQPQQPSQPGGSEQGTPWYFYAAIGVVAAAVIGGVALALAGRRKKIDRGELSEEDIAILKALESLGGEAFQSDIKKIVNLPTTTLWRRIRKLERLGYVKIEKRYGRNYVKMV